MGVQLRNNLSGAGKGWNMHNSKNPAGYAGFFLLVSPARANL